MSADEREYYCWRCEAKDVDTTDRGNCEECGAPLVCTVDACDEPRLDALHSRCWEHGRDISG